MKVETVLIEDERQTWKSNKYKLTRYLYFYNPKFLFMSRQRKENDEYKTVDLDLESN